MWSLICFVLVVSFKLCILLQMITDEFLLWHTGHVPSDGQKLTKKLLTKSLTNFFSSTNSLTKKLV